MDKKRKKFRFEFKIVPVPGDGHCFFRSVVQALRYDTCGHQKTENHQIADLRRELARLAASTFKKSFTKMIDETVSLCYSAPGVDCYLSSTPIDYSFDRDKKFDMSLYTRALVETNTFASFIEVELTRKLLKNHGIALVVVPSEKSLYDSKDWTQTLKKVLGSRRHERMLVLLNHDGAHYSWVLVNSVALLGVSPP